MPLSLLLASQSLSHSISADQPRNPFTHAVSILTKKLNADNNRTGYHRSYNRIQPPAEQLGRLGPFHSYGAALALATVLANIVKLSSPSH